MVRGEGEALSHNGPGVEHTWLENIKYEYKMTILNFQLKQFYIER